MEKFEKEKIVPQRERIASIEERKKENARILIIMVQQKTSSSSKKGGTSRADIKEDKRVTWFFSWTRRRMRH